MDGIFIAEYVRVKKWIFFWQIVVIKRCLKLEGNWVSVRFSESLVRFESNRCHVYDFVLTSRNCRISMLDFMIYGRFSSCCKIYGFKFLTTLGRLGPFCTYGVQKLIFERQHTAAASLWTFLNLAQSQHKLLLIRILPFIPHQTNEKVLTGSNIKVFIHWERNQRAPCQAD